MDKIRLLNAQNEFVHGAMIPHFSEVPDVIVWGSRTFKFTASTNSGKNSESVFEFVECFAYHLSS